MSEHLEMHCPCCGLRTAEIEYGLLRKRVICIACGIQTQWYLSIHDALRIWNYRWNERQIAEMENMRKENSILRKAMIVLSPQPPEEKP